MLDDMQFDDLMALIELVDQIPQVTYDDDGNPMPLDLSPPE